MISEYRFDDQLAMLKATKDVTIIELFNHFEVVERLLSFFEKSAVNLIISQNIVSEIEVDLPQVNQLFIKPFDINLGKFLSSLSNVINRSDLVIICTIEKYFKHFSSFDWPPNTILLIHNGNFWLNYYSSIHLSEIKDFARLARSILFMHQRHRERILSKMKGIMFLAAHDKHSVDRGFKFAEKLLPFTILDMCICAMKCKMIMNLNENNDQNRDKNFTVLVPGSINYKTRDYDTLINALFKLKESILKPVTIVFLGKPKTQRDCKIQRIVQDMSSNLFRIITFEKHVSKFEYSSWFSRSDLCVLPMKKKVKYAECTEFYGITKFSGTLIDAYEFGKEVVLPQEYPLNESIYKKVVRYSNSTELATIIKLKVENSKALSQG